MMLHSIYGVIFLELFIQGSTALELSSVPRIYPSKADVTVDAHTELTLGCRGAEPMRWAFNDVVNTQHYNPSQKNITYMYNAKELEYKYETILTVYNVSCVNVGFFYCHGEKVDFNTPRRSSRIYVFVRDDNNLSVITSEENTFSYYKWFTSIPCRPTSPDINVSVTCEFGDQSVAMSVIPSNYSGIQQGEDYTVRFHPYYGFTVKYSVSSHLLSTCTCYLVKNQKTFSIQMEPLYGYDDYLSEDTYIEGPDTADVGADISLQCVYLGTQYFPYDKFWLQWDIPNSRNKLMEKLVINKLKSFILQINIITLKNISIENEGLYKCQKDTRLESGISATKYVFVNDKKTNNSAPRIHSPDGGDIQINSGENIILRCAGSQPVTWYSLTQVNGYTEHLSNNISGLYESELHVKELRYTDTGFYYCYENGSSFKHPFKSDHIYVYVKDEQNLYVSRQTDEDEVFIYTNMTVPCLPTSRDVNVSLSMEHQAFDKNTWTFSSIQMIDPVIYSYDPREGFTVQVPGVGRDFIVATCIFATETANDKLAMAYIIIGRQFKSEPFLTGPDEDLVFVGQTLELSCTVFVLHNVSVSDDVLRWRTPNNLSLTEISLEIKRINTLEGKVLISKLILNNVKDTIEGWYFCDLAYNNATAGKYISVYDNFAVKPFIHNVHYDYAYIGQPLVLRCKVDVDHNVEFQMSWTTPNGTETKAKTTNTKYIPNIENISGEIIMQINNVTNENKGNYTCYVFDFTNRSINVTKKIMVKKGVKPRIVSSNFNNQEEIDIEIDETANLTCFAEGDPQPEITWMKGSNIVQILGQHYGFASNNSVFTVFFVQRRDAGLYTCIAENPLGRDSRSVNLSVNTNSISGYIATVINMLILCVAVTVLLAIRSNRKKKLLKKLNDAGFINLQFGQIKSLNPFLNIAEQANLLPYDAKWEIPSSKIELGRNLGSGYFGLVVEATISNFFDEEPERTAAVKMLHKNSNFIELNSLICELKILAHIGEHENLINLLGACTEKIAEGKLLVVLEYCKHGSLRSYLIENRCNFVNLLDPDTELICLPADYSKYLQELNRCSSGSVSTLELLRWALQVARGMEFLAARQILHGDLAARNVLLAENYVIKISDFGLSKTLSSSGDYKKKSQCPLPVKWMAIESIRDKTFSTQSDVWAFGVVLWELFSLARTPYAELEPDFRFYRKLESGYRLERPEYSTREMYQVMRECWHAQPQRRPTFSSLVCTLDDLLQETNDCCSVDEETKKAAHRSAASNLAMSPKDMAAPDCVMLDILDTIQICEDCCFVENMPTDQ